MAKKSKGLIRRTAKKAFNVSKWLDTKGVKTGGQIVSGAFRQAFPKRDKNQQHRNENFAEAVNRLGLTEEQLQEKQKRFFHAALIYGGIALVILLYTITAFIHSEIRTGLISLVIFAITSALAYRQHLWYLQTKQRKLGCTFHEWLQLTINSITKPKANVK